MRENANFPLLAHMNFGHEHMDNHNNDASKES